MKYLCLLSSVIVFLLAGCARGGHTAYTLHDEEAGYVGDGTTVIEFEKVRRKSCDLTQLLGEVRYVELDNSRDALLSTVTQIKIADGVIYVMDADERIKCYSTDGTYLRDAYVRGRAHNEVIRAYDFDVDAEYLYVLDGTASKIKVYDHKGVFVASRELPFRALRLKKIAGGWVFESAPFTLKDEYEDYTLAVTDDEFNVGRHYFRYCRTRYTRAPYFPNRAGFEYFNTLFGQGIYRFAGDSLTMEYYYDFGRTFPDDRDVDKIIYAAEKDMFYNYKAVLDADGYIFNGFYTNRNTRGLHIIRRRDGASVFIDGIRADHRAVLGFEWDSNVNGYDESTNEIYGVASYMYVDNVEDDSKDEKLNEIGKGLDEEYRDLLLRSDPDYGVNHIIMFAKLSDSLDSLFD